MEESKRVLEVRALTGESITVSISSAESVGDLEHFLTKNFRLTEKYPCFKLYHKGIKLNSRSKIDKFSFEPGEVIGFVPVSKKQIAKQEKVTELDNLDNDVSQYSTSFADLAWSSIMKVLHEMSDVNGAGGSGVLESAGPSNGHEFNEKVPATNAFPMKRKRRLESETTKLQDSVSDSNGNCEKSVQALDSASFLSPSTRKGCLKKLCHDTAAFLPHEMVEHLKKGIGSHGQIVHVRTLSRRKPTYKEVPSEFSEYTKCALAELGISKLYSHQAESIKASLERKDVAVATMTSSGKSLCYNLPVLEELFNNSSACALYMFPTKALSQDQLRALRAMTDKFDISSYIGIYDGDTLQSERTWLQNNARLVYYNAEIPFQLMTNPDMLHRSILPYHRKFTRILSNLRYIVIDEAHAYKGAFGCHTALILRRLRRLCAHVYGSDPKFIFCTATSANPGEFCMELANLSTVELIKDDGSPATEKFFVMWNPASRPSDALGENEVIVNARKSVNKGRSPIWEVSCLFAEMVQHGLRCITFCTSRKLCELVLSYTQEILHETAPHLVNSITSYRAGYSPEERRVIESELFEGKLLGLAATNALELGIDVGHLDVTLHLGFPGSIASLWQQAGRSGRRERPSLAVYVAFEAALDQYFMKYPEKLFGSPIECCVIDAQNKKVLQQHLLCAANEHPLSLQYDEKFFGKGLCSAVEGLTNSGELSFSTSAGSSARMLNYIGSQKKPSNNINIRAIETEVYQVINTLNNEVLVKIEESKAFFQVHDGAVYMRRGKTYLVKELSIHSKIAWCQEVDLKYFTKTRDYTDVQVTGDMAYPVAMPYILITDADGNVIPRTSAQANNCTVTTTWFGYRCLCRVTNKALNTVELKLPNYSFKSQAVWMQIPNESRRELQLREGLHAASHALLNALPLLRMTFNSYDFAPECPHPDDNHELSRRILLYDKHPGGTGISMQVRPYFTRLLIEALQLISSCGCSAANGCPTCVQSSACHGYNEDLHKESAINIIKCLLDSEKSKFGEL